MDGKNIFDFVDPDIAARLEELEAEESAREAELAAAGGPGAEDDESSLDEDAKATYTCVRARRPAARASQPVRPPVAE
jgi:hypothetical protein